MKFPYHDNLYENTYNPYRRVSPENNLSGSWVILLLSRTLWTPRSKQMHKQNQFPYFVELSPELICM